MIKVDGIQNTQVLWQAVFVAASPLASGGSAAKTLFRERLQYRQLRRLEMPMIFEPNGDSELPKGLKLVEELTKITLGTSSHVTILVRNNTDRNILLKRRTELGRVHMVKSILPNSNSPEQKYTQGEEKPYSEVTSHQGDEQDEWKPPVDSSQLEENEQLIFREMLQQEACAFARNDDDVGCVEDLELEIQLKDNEPVQENYISIPKPLYGEVNSVVLRRSD